MSTFHTTRKCWKTKYNLKTETRLWKNWKQVGTYQNIVKEGLIHDSIEKVFNLFNTDSRRLNKDGELDSDYTY